MGEPHNSNAHVSSTTAHLSPFERFLGLISRESNDLATLVLYVALSGLLSLAVPLAAQALVNTIAAGVFLQPLVVLTLIVFICLILAGVMRLLKLTLLERLQKRVFARVALRIAAHLPQVEYTALLRVYTPQLVNRFFDVITIQKSLAKILIDGPTAILQIVIGLSLLAFYSPYFLAFDVFIILFLIFAIWILGYGGLRTSITESYQKYHVAEWLEEIGRCQTNFKAFGSLPFIIERTDDLVMNYVTARRSHFRVVFRQAAAHYLFRAVISAGVLVVGGWLVINRQITLGQLVAANLIVLSILAATEKLMSLLESFYDLLTALDKVGYVLDLPVETAHDERKILPERGQQGAAVACRGVRFGYAEGIAALENLNLEVEPNSRVSIVGKSGAGKSTLATILSGLLEPTHGAVTIDSMDVREINRASLRQNVAMVSSSNEAFEGTIEENILVGRDFSHDEVLHALKLARLDDDLAFFPQGIKTKLLSEGRNFSRGQIQRLLIARAVLGKPRLLVLDESFTGIDEQDKLQILNTLFDKSQKWTIINISHDPEVVVRTERIYVMDGGRIVENLTPEQIGRAEHSVFGSIFPTLAQNYRSFDKVQSTVTTS